MAGRKLAVNVTTPDDDGRMVTFLAGTSVSAKVAEGITNPSAWGAESEDEKSSKDYASHSKADLESEVAKRNEDREDAAKIAVAGKGNKPDLVQALEADDAAQQ